MLPKRFLYYIIKYMSNIMLYGNALGKLYLLTMHDTYAYMSVYSKFIVH